MSCDVAISAAVVTVVLLSQILVTGAVDTGGINTGGGSAYGELENKLFLIKLGFPGK